MKIIQHGCRWHLKSKTGEVHATNYASQAAAAQAAGKLAAGLIRWQPTTKLIQTWNNTIKV